MRPLKPSLFLPLVFLLSTSFRGFSVVFFSGAGEGEQYVLHIEFPRFRTVQEVFTARLPASVSGGVSILDFSVLVEAGFFKGPLLAKSSCFSQTSLNAFMALGRPAWMEARTTLQKLLSGRELVYYGAASIDGELELCRWTKRPLLGMRLNT